MAKQYQATLIRGETYVLGQKIFRRNMPQPVTIEEKLKLEKSAKDNLVSRTGDEKEVVVRQKFKFVPLAPIAGTTAAPGKKSSKLKELEAMQNDGGVKDWEDEEILEGEDDEEEIDDEDLDNDIEETDEADDEDEEEPPPPVKKKSVASVKSVTTQKPAKRRTR